MAAIRLVWLIPLAMNPWWRGAHTTALVVLTGGVIAMTMVIRSKNSRPLALRD